MLLLHFLHGGFKPCRFQLQNINPDAVTQDKFQNGLETHSRFPHKAGNLFGYLFDQGLQWGRLCQGFPSFGAVSTIRG
jgi:hypothetical protein